MSPVIPSQHRFPQPHTAASARAGRRCDTRLLCLFFAGVAAATHAAGPIPQAVWQPQASPVSVELRGLSAVSAEVAWASGAKGTVLRTTDGGRSWLQLPVATAPGQVITDLDFRDIEAFDADTALIMSAGPGKASTVWRTTDGGRSWQRVLENSAETGFWDAMAFSDRQHGVLFGDPVDGRFQVFTTADGGLSWQAVPVAGMPPALAGEGGFAASGSCVAVQGQARIAFVTGGAEQSRAFVSTDGGRSFTAYTTPVPAGAPPKGLFSVVWSQPDELVAVGGDYKQAQLAGVNATRWRIGDRAWQTLAAAPTGFLSDVTRGPAAMRITVGLAGTGISSDGGHSWQAVDTTPLNSVDFTADGAGWAVGPRGLILRWQAAAAR